MFQRRVINDHDEEESIFISMTDLTVSMMLLLVILLGFFASQFRSASLFDQAEQISEEVSALRLAAAQKDRDMRALTQSVAAQQAEAAALRSETTALEQKVAGVEGERDRAQSALAQATAEFEDSLTIALSNAAELAARLQTSEALLAAERARAVAREDDLARATEALSEQQANNLASDQLRLAHETLEKQVIAQAAKVAALQSELQSLEYLLNAAIQSTTSLLGNRAPKRPTAQVFD
jgi:polyhydroxyalkanoate synthesis regulator phasin